MRILAFLLVLAMIQFSGTTAFAQSCDSVAARLAASKGGSVLSVISMGNKCTIKLLIKSSNRPPKRQTFVVSK